MALRMDIHLESTTDSAMGSSMESWMVVMMAKRTELLMTAMMGTV